MNIQQEFDSLIIKSINADPKGVVSRICSQLEELDIKIYTVVDHQADMDTFQVFSYPAFTILFGNPRMGSKLLEKQSIAAIDIPLRIAVIKSESGNGSKIIIRDMEQLLKDYIQKNEEIRYWAKEVNNTLISLIEQSINK